MIHTLKVEGYRGLNRFEMSGLGRINLLVGTNNCGKTSVLEAIYLVATGGDPASLWYLISRRGERSLATALPPEIPERRRSELDVSHLFSGHTLQPGSRIDINGDNEAPCAVSITVAEPSGEEGRLFEDDLPVRLGLRIEGRPKSLELMIPLSRSGGLPAEGGPMRPRSRPVSATPAQFITTESLAGNELVQLWNKIALTPAETLILRALRFLEPQIERIAAVVPVAGNWPSARGGFIVKLSGIEQPVPIGSMGDGMWRMLAMATAITQCRGGVLLVDEIDTGLHYTVMSQMWQLIFAAAKQLDVQIFATTHSYDCVYSLAQIASMTDSANTVTVQRIEAGKPKAVPYDQEEISVAAAREIEVR